MRYLIIILFFLAACSKQEFKTVSYHVEHYGYGELLYKFDSDSVYKIVKNGVYDTNFILPVVDYGYQFKVEYYHYNETESNIKITITTDSEIKELDRNFKGCYTIDGILTLHE